MSVSQSGSFSDKVNHEGQATVAQPEAEPALVETDRQHGAS